MMRGVNDEPLPRIPCLGADLGWNAGWSCFCHQSFGGRLGNLGNGNPAVSLRDLGTDGRFECQNGNPSTFLSQLYFATHHRHETIRNSSVPPAASIFSLANGDQNKQLSSSERVSPTAQNSCREGKQLVIHRPIRYLPSQYLSPLRRLIESDTSCAEFF